MEAIIYAARCVIALSFTWLCVRMLGKKSISQMSTYDFAVLMILSNIAAAPLAFKVSTKALLGAFIVAIMAVVISKVTIKKKVYCFDSKPEIVIANSKVNKEVLIRTGINLPHLLSLLRLQGYGKVSEVEFAIMEPNGNLSVIPVTQKKSSMHKDISANPRFERLSLPLIIDGLVQHENLRYANLGMDWLNYEIKKAGAKDIVDVFLAELDGSGELFVNLYDNGEEVVEGIY